jgi:hypothetical protein
MIKSACLVEEEDYLSAKIINLVLKALSLAMTPTTATTSFGAKNDLLLGAN